MATREWHALNFEQPHTQHINPSLIDHFTLSAPAGSDTWRKPPAHNIATSPMLYTTTTAANFARARLTVQGAWKEQYDQGGLFIQLPSTKSTTKSRWLKCGIEYEGGEPLLSVVATLGDGADWSLMPLLSGPLQTPADATATIEVERDVKNGVPGTALKIFVIKENGQRFMVRKVTTAFWETEEDGEMWVGAFAARPAKVQDELKVDFSGLRLEENV